MALPIGDGRGRGDLHVFVQPKVPRKLSREQRSVLEHLARVLPPDRVDVRKVEDADTGDRGVFERVKYLFS
jgi:DnaJ-class molecular chaperone